MSETTSLLLDTDRTWILLATIQALAPLAKPTQIIAIATGEKKNRLYVAQLEYPDGTYKFTSQTRTMNSALIEMINILITDDGESKLDNIHRLKESSEKKIQSPLPEELKFIEKDGDYNALGDKERPNKE